MPKGKKASKVNEKADSSTSTTNSTQSAVTMSKDGNIIISIQAKPGAKQNNITGNRKAKGSLISQREY